MSIKFWTPRHRTALYNAFDQVRLYNFAILEGSFVADMLDQKITQKAQRRIESEWITYWEDIFSEEPNEESSLLVYKINSGQFLLMLAGNATEIAIASHEKYEDLFISNVGEIDEES